MTARDDVMSELLNSSVSDFKTWETGNELQHNEEVKALMNNRSPPRKPDTSLQKALNMCSLVLDLSLVTTNLKKERSCSHTQCHLGCEPFTAEITSSSQMEHESCYHTVECFLHIHLNEKSLDCRDMVVCTYFCLCSYMAFWAGWLLWMVGRIYKKVYVRCAGVLQSLA